MGSSKPPKTTRILAPIRSDETYPLAVLRGITGWGDAALRAARKKGLKLIYLHKKVFCRGADLVEYIELHGAEKP